MKAARIRKGGGIFSLESTDSRIAAAHEKVSGCRQKAVAVKLTQVAIEESDERSIRRIVNQRFCFLGYFQRMVVLEQILRKRDEIIIRLGSYDIAREMIADLCGKVEAFYAEPENKKRLECLMERKASVHLLPSPNDMRLLAECCFIRDKERKEVILLTDDSHFTGFSQEIMERFGIVIERI